VVEDSSSELDYAHEQKDFIRANHVNMCRFSGFQDDGYEKTKDCLTLCLECIKYDLPHRKLRLSYLLPVFQRSHEVQNRLQDYESVSFYNLLWLLAKIFKVFLRV
jgi:hypothetical protein